VITIGGVSVTFRAPVGSDPVAFFYGPINEII